MKYCGHKAEEHQFSSVTQSCLTLCDPMDCSIPGFPVLHYLPEFAQMHVLWVGNAIQSSCPLSFPSPPAFNISQRQGHFRWVGSSHQVAEVLELLHQYVQWIFKVMKVKKESEKAGLKLNIQKMKIMASGPITSWQIEGEKMETATDYFLGFQNHCRQWLQPWN